MCTLTGMALPFVSTLCVYHSLQYVDDKTKVHRQKGFGRFQLMSDSQITVTLKLCAWTLRHGEMAMDLTLNVHSAQNSQALPWKGNHLHSGKQRGEMKDLEMFIWS